MASSTSRILVLALLGFSAAAAFAAHAKPRSVDPIDVDFKTGDSGAIEASFNPPIQGVVRIVVQAKAPANHSDQDSSAAGRSFQGKRKSMTLEVTQWDRSIPFRLVSQNIRHRFFGSRASLLVAEVDVNDLTPGVPVRVRVYSDLPLQSDSAQTDLEAYAYAVVY